MADILDDATELVRLFRRLADARRDEVGDDKVAGIHQSRATMIEALVAEVRELRRWKMPVPSSYGDISDLPEELLDQLSGIKTDELEEQIYAIVKAAGPEIELDRLLIELFRRFGDVHERRFLNNKCYRMAQKGLIFQVPGRKGVYTTLKPETPDSSEDVSRDAPKLPTGDIDFKAELDEEIPF